MLIVILNNNKNLRQNFNGRCFPLRKSMHLSWSQVGDLVAAKSPDLVRSRWQWLAIIKPKRRPRWKLSSRTHPHSRTMHIHGLVLGVESGTKETWGSNSGKQWSSQGHWKPCVCRSNINSYAHTCLRTLKQERTDPGDCVRGYKLTELNSPLLLCVNLVILCQIGMFPTSHTFR